MSGFVLGQKSLERLNGVDPNLAKVVKRAIEISEVDFKVIEGLRTRERQQYLVSKGASKTMNSRHLTGHAVDLAAVVGGVITWDWAHYHRIAAAMKKASEELGVELVWGGSWSRLSLLTMTNGRFKLSSTFPDGPHFEIAR
jgi:peptidoglycan L-alanyl-D-glutamate endopeptidase CwlK